MTYATQQNITDRFGATELAQLTDRVNGTVIDAAVVAKALGDADGEINGYIGSRYALPLAPVPTIIERLACDMARYYLYEDRVTLQVQARYNAALVFLTNIAKGVVTLGADSQFVPPMVSDGAQIDAGDRVFTRGKAGTSTVGTLDDY
jgi:phage gp36-like protein